MLSGPAKILTDTQAWAHSTCHETGDSLTIVMAHLGPLRHEEQHSTQFAVLAPVPFPLMYVAAHGYSSLTTGTCWCANIFEIDASVAGDVGYEC